MSNKIVVIGVKESFLIKALIKKLKEASYDPVFCLADVDEIHNNWETASVLVYYTDSQEYFKPDVLHFIQERLSDRLKSFLLIGDKSDMENFGKGVNAKLISKKFTRPLDMDVFMETVAESVHEEAVEKQKKKIMIVDDDTTYLGVVRDWLKKDYTVHMANSGLQAIKALGSHPVDLILLDHEMPVTSGPQVLEMLRSDPETSSIPVIFLTGKSDKNSVMQVMGLKPQGYLLKTIEQDELLFQIRAFFEKNGK